MTVQRALILILLLSVVSGMEAGEKYVEVTKKSKKAFNIANEVVAFTQQVIETDPKAKAQYEELVRPTKEHAGGRNSFGEFEAIEWLVPEFSVDFRNGPSSRDGEFLYLVRQPMWAGEHRGYTVLDNVVARVSVKLHEDHAYNATKDDHTLSGATLTLRFEGFVSVELKPR